ncbi:MAG TPA: metalloregulator ArsR/SmtB family transcription factor [Terriglobales bacterium]|nr:metalloregulator ArsR/SmtB family transcription factor [Terriglobales bacterium]
MARSLGLESLFRALADPTRLRILNLMAESEICVCFFVAILGASQPKVSRHLAYLRRAGLVAARRDGKWMHYRIATPAQPQAAAILRSTLDAMRHDPKMQRDRARLTEACCGVKKLVGIADAPLPSLVTQ